MNSGRKNAYIKFMCWFYYRFEKIIAFLGAEQLPKILYEGNIGSNELLFMNVLFLAGCDVLLLQYGGDSRYLEIDPASERSRELKMPDLAPFPEGFSYRLGLNRIAKCRTGTVCFDISKVRCAYTTLFPRSLQKFSLC